MRDAPWLPTPIAIVVFMLLTGPLSMIPAPVVAGEAPFRAQIAVADATTLLVTLSVAPAHHLYRHQLKLSIVAPNDPVAVATFAWPTGTLRDEPGMGQLEVYGPGDTAARVPLIRQTTGEVTIQARLRFQGCADAGFCLAPETAVATLSLPIWSAGLAAPTGAVGTPLANATTSSVPLPTSTTTATVPLDKQEALAHTLATSSLASTLLSFFGFGLLLAFTPCVFPMIPILSGIIVGQGKEISTWRAFMLSLAYVLAMALTYTVAGVAAGLMGRNIQAALQNPYALSAMAGLLVVLALSMFGLYELQLPSSWQTRLNAVGRSQQGGTWIGAAVMGVFSALMVGPCVAPPLAGALIYIGQTGDALLGGFALFALSLGMGTPLLLVGTTAGRFLPRAGMWMDRVKAVFGVVMLAVAVSMVARVFPPLWIMLAWAVLCIGCGVFLDALEPLAPESGPLARLGKALGIAMLAWGILVAVGAASGADDPMRPLAKLVPAPSGALTSGASPGAAATAGDLAFKTVRSLAELDRELASAKSARRPVLVDVWATWCTACHELDSVSFADAAIRRELATFVLIRFDVSDNGDPVTEFYRQYRVVGPPTLLFFAADGLESRAERQTGFVAPDALMGLLARIGR